MSVCDNCQHKKDGSCPLCEDYMWETEAYACFCDYKIKEGEKNDKK